MSADVPALPDRAPRLIGSRGDVPLGEWLLPTSGSLRFGRSPKCDVVLEDDAVSRTHLEVRPIEGGWEVEDLGSKSGTWFAGERVSHRRLRSGDRIRIGRIQLLAVDIHAEPQAHPGPRTRATPPSTPPLLPPLPYSPARPAAAAHSTHARANRALLWSAAAVIAALCSAAVMVALVAAVVGGWHLVNRVRSRDAPPPVVVKPPTTPPLHSEVAAQALLKPSLDGGARRTPLGSFTTTATGGRLAHAEITVEVPAGALPEGTPVTISRIDAAPVGMRDSFPVARFGDFTPLSAIFVVEAGSQAPARPATISFPVAGGGRFTWLAVITWDPTANAWESFPARFDPASGRATAEVGALLYLHLLGLDEGGEASGA